MPIKPIRLYVIDGVDYDAVIAQYRKLCETGIVEIDDTGISVTGGFELTSTYKKKPRKPLRNDTKVLNKAKYIAHTVAYRQATAQFETSSPINMSVLQDVIGEDAFELMASFLSLGYIQRTTFYRMGETSRRYNIPGKISITQTTNATLIKYILKSKEIVINKAEVHFTSEEFKKEYGETFYPTYLKNLNRFTIQDTTGFNKYIKQEVELHPTKEPYYYFIKQSFKHKLRLFGQDRNKRIYHILTSLERELKPYINIRYDIDFSNSHPFLFNYFIFLSKGISKEVGLSITRTLGKNMDLTIIAPIQGTNNYTISTGSDVRAPEDGQCITLPRQNYYNTKKLRNILIDSGIDKSEIDKLEDDELLYVWKTSTGIFWDDVLLRHADEGLDRSKIKQTMFAEVFYSKTLDDAWKRFAQEFKSQYPHVYNLILEWKRPLSNPKIKELLLQRGKAIEVAGFTLMTEDKQDTALPNIMMTLESAIFRDILKSLYRKRICAVHIHDAIIIPAVKSTEKLDPELVCDIMLKEAAKYGLCPGMKVETF